MTQFKEGTKVITIVDGELKTGHIARVYDALKTAIVKFDDRTAAKVAYKDLALAENTQAEPEKEYADGMKEIDRVDFEEQIDILLDPNNINMQDGSAKLMLCVVGSIVSQKLIAELFGDNDHINIDYQILFSKIANATDPVKLAGEKAESCYCGLIPVICLTVATTFFDLLDHYFGNDSDNA